jgi:xanthosine utilization system XapX-like protein
MSELQLSAILVGEIQSVLKAHDPASEDPGVTSQYLCAVVGFLLGQQDMPSDQKTDVLEQLSAFMKHVAEDVDGQRQSAAQPAAPPQQEAFGIWKPKS